MHRLSMELWNMNILGLLSNGLEKFMNQEEGFEYKIDIKVIKMVESYTKSEGCKMYLLTLSYMHIIELFCNSRILGSISIITFLSIQYIICDAIHIKCQCLWRVLKWIS